MKILGLLTEAGIKAEGVKRGLDHGVWCGFHAGESQCTLDFFCPLPRHSPLNIEIAFHPERNPLNVPIVQVSLFGNEDPDAHYRLGQAVASLRDEGIVIVGAGMSVHNLRDFRFTMGSKKPMPYAVSFDNALKEAVEVDPAQRQKTMSDLLKRPDARQAHPTMDHLLPVHIAAGAAGQDKGKQTWTMPEGSMAWAQYRFGNVPA